jgi:hypothetical protein
MIGVLAPMAHPCGGDVQAAALVLRNSSLEQSSGHGNRLSQEQMDDEPALTQDPSPSRGPRATINIRSFPEWSKI